MIFLQLLILSPRDQERDCHFQTIPPDIDFQQKKGKTVEMFSTIILLHSSA